MALFPGDHGRYKENDSAGMGHGFQIFLIKEDSDRGIMVLEGFDPADVTQLNIAKTKRKCEIIKRRNYSLSQSEDSRSPKKKEDAVIDAFKHFQMI
ncbi:MAG: hypothetical protein ACSW8K_00225 [bacterium]